MAGLNPAPGLPRGDQPETSTNRPTSGSRGWSLLLSRFGRSTQVAHLRLVFFPGDFSARANRLRPIPLSPDSILAYP